MSDSSEGESGEEKMSDPSKGGSGEEEMSYLPEGEPGEEEMSDVVDKERRDEADEEMYENTFGASGKDPRGEEACDKEDEQLHEVVAPIPSARKRKTRSLS